jgi:hypothetical protein
MPRPAGYLLIFCATAAWQRLDTLHFFARFLIDGGVAEVDVPVQARVGVVLLVRCGVEGIVGWRYPGDVHNPP